MAQPLKCLFASMLSLGYKYPHLALHLELSTSHTIPDPIFSSFLIHYSHVILYSAVRYTYSLHYIEMIKTHHLSAKLLESAWLECHEAQRFYADSRVRNYYTQHRLLDIKQLSGLYMWPSQQNLLLIGNPCPFDLHEVS